VGLETKVILWKYSNKHRFKLRLQPACFTEKKSKWNPKRALCAMLAYRQGNSHRNNTYICYYVILVDSIGHPKLSNMGREGKTKSLQGIEVDKKLKLCSI